MKFFILGVAASSLIWAAVYFWREYPGREIHIYPGQTGVYHMPSTMTVQGEKGVNGGGDGGSATIHGEDSIAVGGRGGSGGFGSGPIKVWGPWQKNEKGELFRCSTDGLSSEFK